MNGATFAVSPFTTLVESEGRQRPLWKIESRDLARGLCGGLFLAMPLLYTLEMWQRARVIPAWDMVLIVGLCYLANVGFGQFTGFKPRDDRRAAWFDALTAMGIGIVAAIVTLLLINQISFATPAVTASKLVLLEMVPISFGASLAINQLGSRRQQSESWQESALSPDARKVLGTTLGAAMFSFNIAPTIETQMIGNGLTWYHVTGLVFFSLAVSALMVFFARFVHEDDGAGVMRGGLVETLVAYVVSLLVSALLLWMFGFINFGTPTHLVVPWVVTMGYATTLAGAAGRLIL